MPAAPRFVARPLTLCGLFVTPPGSRGTAQGGFYGHSMALASGFPQDPTERQEFPVFQCTLFFNTARVMSCIGPSLSALHQQSFGQNPEFHSPSRCSLLSFTDIWKAHHSTMCFFILPEKPWGFPYLYVNLLAENSWVKRLLISPLCIQYSCWLTSASCRWMPQSNQNHPKQ
jgi:hypothetical protein